MPALLEYFFSLCLPRFWAISGPRMSILIFVDFNDFYWNVLLPHIFTWTFKLHCLRGKTQGRAIPP